MKIKIISLIFLVSFLFLNTKFCFAALKPLKVSDNGRYLTTSDGNPLFLNADTCWQIPWKLTKEEIEFYLNKRKEQKFNAIGLVAFAMERVATNVYGDHPFTISDGKYNPLSPIIKKEYDYWDHIEHIIDSAANKGIYIILLPTWGSRVAGDYRTGKSYSALIFDEKKAYKYGKWIAERYKNKNNIIWMLGGDRNAVMGKYDYRNVFNSLAKGLIAGSGNKKILISYHPRKWQPNSSAWFHNESWLSFNSIQDGPIDQMKAINYDLNLQPKKPTWLFEGGYEGRTRTGGYVYKDWQVRLQAYQTVFAGAFGETYGNMSIWDFKSDWKKRIDDPGANQLCHLVYLMSLLSKEQYLGRVPDQSLLSGDTGKMTGCEGMLSSLLTATRTKKGDLAMIYSANGGNITLKMHLLKGPKMYAYWFNPRTAQWGIRGKQIDKITPFKSNIRSGKRAENYQFDAPDSPGNANDWVLILSNKKLKT